MNKIVKLAFTLGLLGSGALSNQAQAESVVGDIEFFGAASASGPSNASPPVTPVTITFTNPWQIVDVTLGSTYEMAGITTGSASTTLSNFTFTGDGALASLSGGPILPEWTFIFNGTTYSFDLATLTDGHVAPSGPHGLTSMSFSGTGTVHATGFDDTPANWSLEGSGTNFNFTLSTSTTSSIPEAGVTSLLLLGSALLTGCSLRRKR
jgi:hypothetical protein